MVSSILVKLMILISMALRRILPYPTNPVKIALPQTIVFFRSVKNISALKIYWDESPLDLEKIEKIETGLAAQNLRYPLYNYVHLPASENPYWPETTAKFEEFLSDRKDFNEISIEPNVVRLEIAKRLGKLHSATDIEGVNKDQYRDHGATWWNTYQTSTHIGKTQGTTLRQD